MTTLLFPANLWEGAKAVVSMFKDAAGDKVSKEELAHTVARTKFQLALGIKGHNGYISMLGPKVLVGTGIAGSGGVGIRGNSKILALLGLIIIHFKVM